MTNDTDTQLESINRAMLTPLVRQALGSETLEVIEWHCQEIHRSGTPARVYRFSGEAQDKAQTAPWSLILKTVPPMPNLDNPSGPTYWKREVLAYQSGLLQDLPGDLAAPKCFGVVEQPEGGFWLWLEEVRDDIGADWPLAHYGVVARHLGQFNGAYLVGRPIPSEPWLSRGRIYPHIDQADLQIRHLRDSLDHPLVQRAYAPAADSLFRVFDDREAFLAAANHLPRTYCHHDAFRRNLFAQRDRDGGYHTVAIDWAYAGSGVIGEELVYVVISTFGFFEVATEELPELDAIGVQRIPEWIARGGLAG